MVAKIAIRPCHPPESVYLLDTSIASERERGGPGEVMHTATKITTPVNRHLARVGFVAAIVLMVACFAVLIGGSRQNTVGAATPASVNR